jgi:organic hydroperoxide reductase OsmC/OhrA
MFSVGGRQVAGGGPLLNASQQPEWCTYVGAQIKLPSIHDRALADELVSGADGRCPYSNAVRGNIDVAINVLEPTA